MASAPPGVLVRLHEMDGLRGWAALSVVLSHLLFGVFGNLQPPLLAPSVKPFLEPFLGGTLDVAVFFVLSGDALSAAYWVRHSREGVVRLAVKRYFRLGLPIFVSCLIAFVLLKSGLVFNHSASQVLNVERWLGTFLQQDFSAIDLVKYSAFGVYFYHTAEGSLNPFLWPMQIELLGSLMVFCYLFAEPDLRLKLTVLIFLMLLCLGGGSLLACFPFGVLCGYVRAHGGFDWLRRQRAAQVPAFLFASIALVVGTYCNRIWQGWFPPTIIAACIIVFSVYTSTALCRFFSNPLSRWLGLISFPLYLMQFAVFVSFTSGMVVLAHAQGVLGPATIWLIILASAVLCVLAAALFLPVEVLSVRICDLVCRAVMRGELTIGRLMLLPTIGWVRRPGTPAGDQGVAAAPDARAGLNSDVRATGDMHGP